MKLLSILALLLPTAALAANANDCKASCQKLRRELLQDVSSSVCRKASNHNPIPKLFTACIDGRKKGFDSNCLSMCLDGVNAADSFAGCKASKGNAAKPNMLQWCRQGYDETLATLKNKFAPEKPILKESVPAAVEPETVAIKEPVKEEPISVNGESENSSEDEEAIESFVFEDADESFEAETEEEVPLAVHRNLRSDDSVQADENEEYFNNDEM